MSFQFLGLNSHISHTYVSHHSLSGPSMTLSSPTIFFSFWDAGSHFSYSTIFSPIFFPSLSPLSFLVQFNRTAKTHVMSAHTLSSCSHPLKPPDMVITSLDFPLESKAIEPSLQTPFYQVFSWIRPAQRPFNILSSLSTLLHLEFLLFQLDQ